MAEPTREQLLALMHVTDQEFCTARDSPAGQVEAILDFYRRQWEETHPETATAPELSSKPEPPSAGGVKVPGQTPDDSLPTPEEQRRDELLKFMPRQLREEYDKADERRKAALWKANERNFEDAREREEQRLRQYQEKTEKTLDLLHRLKEDPNKTHLLPPDDASMGDLHKWHDEMSKPDRKGIPFPEGSLGETLLRNTAYMRQELDEFEERRVAKERAKPESVEVASTSAPKPQTSKNSFRQDVWAEIKKHKGWYVVAFLLGGLPVGIATVWPTITHETVPEWLAQNGLPRLSTLVIGWVAIAAIIALVIVIRSCINARRRIG